MASPVRSNRASSISAELDLPLTELGKSRSDGDLARRRSLSRRASLCVNPNLEELSPNLPSPIHAVSPKIWFLPPLKKKLNNRVLDTEVIRDEKEYVLWIDLTFRSETDFADFEEELKRVRKAFERVNFQAPYCPANLVYELLPTNSSISEHPCIRITSTNSMQEGVLRLLYESFPGLNHDLDLKIDRIIANMKKPQEEEKCDV